MPHIVVTGIDSRPTFKTGSVMLPVPVHTLLGRAEHTIDAKRIKDFLFGVRVLITGAGGSIGSEVARVAARDAKELTLIEFSEVALAGIVSEIKDYAPQLSLRPVLCDIRDIDALERIFEVARPEVVIHTAAFKHVDITESNPLETLRNNFLATLRLGQLCTKFGAYHIFSSSDKAVQPANLLGATKRAAELALMHVSSPHGGSIVRFGNVLGSSGSAIKVFERQINADLPITLTDPAMMRYFITVREAVGLTLQAGALGAERPGVNVFMCDMGAPQSMRRIVDQLLAASKKTLPIHIVGVRQGEKMNEDLVYPHEQVIERGNGILEIKSDVTKSDLHAISKLADAVMEENARTALKALASLVPEYTPVHRTE